MKIDLLVRSPNVSESPRKTNQIPRLVAGKRAVAAESVHCAHVQLQRCLSLRQDVVHSTLALP